MIVTINNTGDIRKFCEQGVNKSRTLHPSAAILLDFAPLSQKTIFESQPVAEIINTVLYIITLYVHEWNNAKMSDEIILSFVYIFKNY